MRNEGRDAARWQMIGNVMCHGQLFNEGWRLEKVGELEVEYCTYVHRIERYPLECTQLLNSSVGDDPVAILFGGKF